jgi:hypothetical protein
MFRRAVGCPNSPLTGHPDSSAGRASRNDSGTIDIVPAALFLAQPPINAVATECAALTRDVTFTSLVITALVCAKARAPRCNRTCDIPTTDRALWMDFLR